MSGSSKLGFIALTLSMILSTIACSGSDIDIETKPVELRFQFPYPRIDHPTFIGVEEMYKETAAAYGKTNPGISVTFSYLGDNEQLNELLQSDNSPDIVEYWGPGGELNDNLLDLQTFSMPAGESALDPSLNNLALIDGKMPLLPYFFDPFVVIYNKDFFDEAQIPYPGEGWTWEQYRDISRQLKGGSLFAYMPQTFNLLMASLGVSSIIAPDGGTAVGYLDSPEAIQALRWLNGYLHDNPTRTSPDGGLGSNYQFSNLQTGMELANYTSYTLYTTEFKERADRIGVAPLPHFESGERVNLVSYKGYGISKNSKHPQEAWKFINFLAGASNDFFKFGDFYSLPNESGSGAVMENKDLVKDVFANELKYAIPYRQSEVWNKPELAGEFAALFHVSDEDVPDRLHALALQIDRELDRLKIEEGQRERTG